MKAGFCINIMRQKDITGERFNRLVAIKFVKRVKNHYYWLFKCDCGKEKVMEKYDVTRTHSKSCGCINTEVSTKHGEYNIPLYKKYTGAKTRTRESNPKRHLYFDKEIIFMWNKYLEFKEDMEESFIEHCKIHGLRDTTLDRIDGNKSYCKDNCRWATYKVQRSNISKPIIN